MTKANIFKNGTEMPARLYISAVWTVLAIGFYRANRDSDFNNLVCMPRARFFILSVSKCTTNSIYIKEGLLCRSPKV